MTTHIGQSHALGHCPVCLAPLAPDGSHIALSTGAHIPPPPREIVTQPGAIHAAVPERAL